MFLCNFFLVQMCALDQRKHLHKPLIHLNNMIQDPKNLARKMRP